jgi:cell division protein FtsZ
MSNNSYSFELPKHHKSIIKVIGVGGGGSNAVNHMFSQGIKDVEFIICNTDSQALMTSSIPNKLQIGANLTQGLGAGANPEKGMNAALESKEDIREMLSEDTKMVFITAGMGGGTGTGAAPVIARVARELDILTVGIVTAPFGFEGRKKMLQADAGIRELKENCDTVLVILNDKLREIHGNLSIRDAFAQADNVLTTAAKGIAEIITVPGYVNVDFEDVKTVMRNSGSAVMGHQHPMARTGPEELLRKRSPRRCLMKKTFMGQRRFFYLLFQESRLNFRWMSCQKSLILSLKWLETKQR